MNLYPQNAFNPIQTEYNLFFRPAILGMQAFVNSVRDPISRIARGLIYYGRAIIQSRLFDDSCRLPRQNKFTITFNTNSTISAGTLTTVITAGKAKNGEVDASWNSAVTVATSYSGTYNTLAKIVAKHALDIKAAMADCYSCEVSLAGSNLVITYIGDCDDLSVVTSAFSGLGSGDDVSVDSVDYAQTADEETDILGISYLTHNRMQQLTGVTYYSDTEPVNIMQKGSIWVYAEEAVKPSDEVYARLLINGTKYAGYWGKSYDSGKCAGNYNAKFLETISTAGLVPLEVNWPQ
jgi:hypothetical protein